VIAGKPDLHEECMLTLIAARNDMKIRHAPIYAAVAMCCNQAFGSTAGRTLSRVIKRPDEIGEAILMYGEIKGRRGLGNQLRQGLRSALRQFDEYQLAKWQGKGNALPLATAMQLLHPEPINVDQSILWARLTKGELVATDTREAQLAEGVDRKAGFESLLRSGKMGRMALIKSLRLMHECGVDHKLINAEIRREVKNDPVLPFRYMTAVDHAPQFAPALQDRMIASRDALDQFDGVTWAFVDVSGSMTSAISERSQVQRMDAGAALAGLWPGDVRVVCFGTESREVASLGGQIKPEDRVIVFTDEQMADSLPETPAAGQYCVNLANYGSGIAYGSWVSITGFSAQLFKYIKAYEELG